MAGDWIKMRGNLWDDPRVSKLCDLTDQSEAAIVGALYWLWAAADQHTEDGLMPGLTLRQIDRKTGVQGFGAALCQIGWLEDNPDGVRIVNFEEHNGTSAKRRCTDAQRKANVRNVSASDADKQRTESGQKTPNLGAREEKKIRQKKRLLRSRHAARRCRRPGHCQTTGKPGPRKSARTSIRRQPQIRSATFGLLNQERKAARPIGKRPGATGCATSGRQRSARQRLLATFGRGP